jgi:hypothetical protein
MTHKSVQAQKAYPPTGHNPVRLSAAPDYTDNFHDTGSIPAFQQGNNLPHDSKWLNFRPVISL